MAPGGRGWWVCWKIFFFFFHCFSKNSNKNNKKKIKQIPHHQPNNRRSSLSNSLIQTVIYRCVCLMRLSVGLHTYINTYNSIPIFSQATAPGRLGLLFKHPLLRPVYLHLLNSAPHLFFMCPLLRCSLLFTSYLKSFLSSPIDQILTGLYIACSPIYFRIADFPIECCTGFPPYSLCLQ